MREAVVGPKDNAKSKSSEASEMPKVADNDEFYIYIYEEDQFQSQQKFNFKTKNPKLVNNDTNRKMGFWCFNASVGMK